MTNKTDKTQPEKTEPVTGLDLLRKPFPPNQISKLPKPTRAQTDAVRADFKKGIRCQVCGTWHHPQVVHLDYVGHAALTDRLLDCDPKWNWEPVAINEDGTPRIDGNGGMWIRLTVCDVTRLGYGHADNKKGGDAIKEVIGDALRNAAMRFGAALDLWHKGDLHADEPADDNADDDKAVEKPKRSTSKAEDDRWMPPEDDTPFDGGHPPVSDTDVIVELTKIETISDLGELKGYWSALAQEQPAIARDQRVIDAKDMRKSDLMREQKENAA